MLLRAIIGIALLVPISTLAAAQEKFPTKTVSMISPYQPGGTSGLIAQTLAQKLSESWGQPVIIENKPGASGAVGVTALIRAPADGHTLIAIASNALTVNPLVFRNLGYDVAKTWHWSRAPGWCRMCWSSIPLSPRTVWKNLFNW